MEVATAVVCVEGREGGRWAEEVEGDCVYRKEISSGTKHNTYHSNDTQRK